MNLVAKQNPSPSQLAARAGDNFAKMEKVLLLLRRYYGTDEGSWAPLFTLASDNFKKEQSGLYLRRDVKPTTIWESSHAKNMQLAEKLEKWTEEEMTKDGWMKNL